MTQTAVPTIRDIIDSTLRDAGYGSYASMGVVDQIVSRLAERERTIYGETTTDQPVTDEILRRLNQDAVPAEDLPLAERVARLETEVANLTGFARDNGYRL
jgi:hypothetical protein